MRRLQAWLERLSPEKRLWLVCDVCILALFVEMARVFLVAKGIPIPLWVWVL